MHKGTYKDPDTGKERTIALKKIADQKSFILEEVRFFDILLYLAFFKKCQVL